MGGIEKEQISAAWSSSNKIEIILGDGKATIVVDYDTVLRLVQFCTRMKSLDEICPLDEWEPVPDHRWDLMAIGLVEQ
jgi:hypothetical protein